MPLHFARLRWPCPGRPAGLCRRTRIRSGPGIPGPHKDQCPAAMRYSRFAVAR
jgi:hypothetical protein